MFKKLCVFLLMPTLLSSPVQTVDRSKLNFEVLDIQISNDNIIVNGWAVINDSQHFKDGSTHSHVLELKTSTETLEVVGELTNIDMTQQLEYRGMPTCSKNALNQSNCNYEFKKVGFKFTIPLTILKEDSDYEMFLKMNAKQVNRTYRIPLFYVQKHDTILKKGNMEYIILSDYDHIGFSVFKSTLVARTGPSPLSDQLSIGKSCSVAYGNGAFLRQSANFNNILDISLYNGLITYFKVQVQESGCVNQRQRVIESSNSKIYTYVPSTHVNYRGNPAVLYVRSHKTAPNLFVESATLYQYETYNPLDYAHAQDETDGQITDQIKVTHSNVNMKVPGNYTTCYTVKNSHNLSTYKCGPVIVLERPTKRRFISKFTLHNTHLSLWNRDILKQSIFKEQGLRHKQLDLEK